MIADSCNAPTAAHGFTLTSQYLLDQSGEQASELTGAGAWLHSNVWQGGRLTGTYDARGLHFALSDPLGTKRVHATVTATGLGAPELNFLTLPYGNNLGNTLTTAAVPVGAGGTDATEHHFTGKERDAESGNDYFGARYYASTMGRFMSPDPLYLEIHRLVDPQQLNLYAYGRNNPLRYTDSTGLDVNLDCSKVSSDACNKTVGDLNNRKGAQFTVGRDDKTGLLTVEGKVDTSKLSSGEAALYNAISDTDHHATLSVVSESGDIQFGRFDGNGHNTLDRSDLNLLGKVSPQAAGETVAHEALEAYGSSFANGTNYDLWHGYANQFFGNVQNSYPENLLTADHQPAYIQYWNFQRIGVNVGVKTITTPQPDLSLEQGFVPGRMVEAWPVPAEK